MRANKGWTKEELICIRENYGKLDNKSIGKLINRTANAVRIKAQRIDITYSSLIYKKAPLRCLRCEKELIGKLRENKKFCSHSCSATYNNKLGLNKPGIKILKTVKCLLCENCFKTERKTNVYCSKKCEIEYKRMKVFSEIEKGDGIFSERKLKKYLIEKYGEECMECGWDKINIITNKVPIELEHIDGDSTNNDLQNLKLLCPNCHSLTSTYKALNVGKGRHKRRERYKAGKSF